jgi:hypothetical protein
MLARNDTDHNPRLHLPVVILCGLPQRPAQMTFLLSCQTSKRHISKMAALIE